VTGINGNGQRTHYEFEFVPTEMMMVVETWSDAAQICWVVWDVRMVDGGQTDSRPNSTTNDAVSTV
jgi:hypothetical protein